MSVSDDIKEKIHSNFTVIHLEVVNESHLHKGHAGDDGSGESHFRVVLVSDDFDGLSRLERQKKVKSVLAQELVSQIHAFSLSCQTSKEFKK